MISIFSLLCKSSNLSERRKRNIGGYSSLEIGVSLGEAGGEWV